MKRYEFRAGRVGADCVVALLIGIVLGLPATAAAQAAAPDFLGLLQVPVVHDRIANEIHLMRIEAGGVPALLPDGWNAVGDAVLALGDSLASHGVQPSVASVARRQRLREASLELLASQWTGRPVDDLGRARRLLETDMELAREAIELVRILDVDRQLAPEAPWGVQRRLLRAFGRWTAPTVLIRTFWPAFDDYDRLQTALAHYRQIQADGGFVKLPKRIRRARSQKEHATVAALKRRLAQEHRGIENVDDLFWGDDVDTALADARANVQLSQKSRRRRLDRHLRRALAVPVEKRITTIERDLRRLRQSERNDHHYLVYVNLPEYHGEIWAGANLVHRFRVVVGGKRRINSTPRITSKIHTVIFNPFWNVPRRIYQTEMKGAADKWIEEGNGTEPKDYWASKGYELKGRNPKTQWLRRPPGRGNPLGKVKFLFENRHAVFLHDTPSKKLFRKPRRAFSHGCIRVQHPVEFAEQLLRRDGSWDVAQSEGVMHHYRRTPIRLRRPVPLVLDYITTRVTEDGHVMFLSDLYKLARPRRK